MFENTPDFLILVELELVPRNKLPSTLRLLMNTRTHLECTDTEDRRFWHRLTTALGTPLSVSSLQVNSEIAVSNTETNINFQTDEHDESTPLLFS
jgi:hypothetical protein